MAETRKLAIMIVDDRPENLASMKQVLARDDLDILTAESGNEALGLMLEKDLALVLLDVQMPGMDGFEVADLMRRNDRTRRIPIIFVTAINKERRHIFSGFNAGAVDYMFKPVDPFIIRSKVDIFLDIKRNELARECLVTDLNVANRRLQEINERKSDFLSAASHELRTPLTIIKEYCGLVHDEVVGGINPEQKRCLEAALRNCNRLADLVNDLLDLDSIESGHTGIHRASVDLGRALTDAYSDFIPRCASVGQTIRMEMEDNLPAALGDAQMLTQVLVNLLGNAHKFTPDEGEILIRGKVTPEGVRVEVQDNGPGIAAEDQAKVFEKFTQLNRKDGPGARGTGLGLAISHKIIELHGGELGLRSLLGHGSVFHFTVPVYDTALHLQAFVTDSVQGGRATQEDWTLVLLRPAPGQKIIPAWLEKAVKQNVRQTDDLPTETRIEGDAVKALLLQAPMEGALAFLGRLDECLSQGGITTGSVQCALVEIPFENRAGFTCRTEELEFLDLALIQDSKGKCNV